MFIVCYYLFFITHSSSVEHSIGRWAYQLLVIAICFLCLILFGSGNVALASFPINLEEQIRLPSPHRINFSVCLSVRYLWKHVEFLKSGCPRGVFCLSSIPSEYLFQCTRRKFGFNKKICTKLLIVYVYFQPNSCNTHAEREWAQGTFLRQRRKVPPAHPHGCLVKIGKYLPKKGTQHFFWAVSMPHGWGHTKPLGGWSTGGKVRGILVISQKGRLARESPGKICIRGEQTFLAHRWLIIFVSCRLTA